MKRILFLCLCLVTLLIVAGPWTAGFAQQPQTSQSQANPPSGGQTQPGNDQQYRQSQNDSNTRPASPNNTPTTTADRPEETRSAFSWGSALVGLIIGGIIGYFIGHAPPTNVAGRRDRVA
jgi:cytoskeletal protein RodZ